MARRNKNRKSVMAHTFSQIPNVKIPRSSFNRSHGLKTTFDGGLLVPILVDEALPGDSFNVRMTGFARMATPLHPIMDNLFMETFFFAVPYRLVWDNWQKFNGEQDNPDDSTDFLIPTFSVPGPTGVAENTIFDYMGLPLGTQLDDINSLPFRAYNLIFNEWFRDQNLQDSVPVPKTDGPDTGAEFAVLRRGKRHDYFTSCLPWPQKSSPVTVPLGDTAAVIPSGNGVPLFDAFSGTGTDYSLNIGPQLTSAMELNAGGNQIAGDQGSNLAWATPALEADLTTATAVTINALREAFQMQRLFERDARGGTRYTEIIRSHFGVVSPDQRLQRPEYLGGGSSMVNINPVAQTTPTNIVPDVTPQGNLAAFGTAALHNHGFTKSFTEHCIILGLINVRADLTYQQGLNRMWSRQTRFDFFWPSLAFLGEQEVLNKEIFADGTDGLDNEVFGYQERYAEYRYKPSQITGQFRSTAATGSLDIWHLAQEFASRPQLNAEFIADNPPIDRVVAVQTEPHFLFDAYFSMKCARPMPLYGVPGLIDHF